MKKKKLRIHHFSKLEEILSGYIKVTHIHIPIIPLARKEFAYFFRSKSSKLNLKKSFSLEIKGFLCFLSTFFVKHRKLLHELQCKLLYDKIDLRTFLQEKSFIILSLQWQHMQDTIKRPHCQWAKVKPFLSLCIFIVILFFIFERNAR